VGDASHPPHPQKWTRSPYDLLAPAVARRRAKRVAGPEGRRARCAEAVAAGGAIADASHPPRPQKRTLFDLLAER